MLPNAHDAYHASTSSDATHDRAVRDGLRACRRAIERACFQRMKSTAVRLPLTSRDNVLLNYEGVTREVADALLSHGYVVGRMPGVPYTLMLSWSDARAASPPREPAVAPSRTIAL
jgi:hypothetical protein